MIIKLNAEAVQQLELIMARTGRTNHTHTIQTMLSQVLKKLILADTKKAERNIV